MNSRYRFFVKSFIPLILSTYCLVGCAENLFSYRGSKITQKELMVRLQDGNQQGIWRKQEIVVMYQYLMTNQSLKLSGTVELAGGNKYFNHLAVYLLFLDEQGMVVEDALIYSGENSRRIITSPMDFEKAISVPQNAMAFTFVHDLTPFPVGGK